MARPRHPDKDIERALRYAEGFDWEVRLASGHAWGRLLCGQHDREGCIISVWSTPRDAVNHAKGIIRAVDRCPHVERDEDDGDA